MRYNQPQNGPAGIDRGNSLSRGLALAVTGGLGFVDVASARNGVRNGVSTTASRAGIGFVAASNASLGASFSTSPMKSSDGVGTGDFTYLVFADPLPSTTREFFVCSSSGNNELYFGANFVVGLGASAGAFSGQTNAGSAAGSAAPGVDGKMHAFGYVRNGLNTSLYLDGAMQTSVALANAAPMWQSNSADIVAGYSGAGWGVSRSVALVLAWNRALSSNEIKQLSINPWQVFQAPTRRLFVAGAAPTSITASLSWNESDEAVSIVSSVTNRVALAWSEGNDASSLNAVISNRSAIAWVESGESSAVVGVVNNQGSIVWAEQSDTLTLTGIVQEPAQASIQVAMAWTEAGEISTVVAQLVSRAAISVAEQGDTWSLTAYAEPEPIRPTEIVTYRFIPLKRDYNTDTIHFSD